MTRVSIILPTYCRADVLEETIVCLDKLNYPKEFYEIIVVDDGSGDSTKTTVSNLQGIMSNIRYLHQKNTGAAAARNFGAREAKYELLLFMDDDILLEINGLQKIVDFHNNNPNAMLSASRMYSRKVVDNLSKTSFGRFLLRIEDSGMDGVNVCRISENLFSAESLASFCLSMTKKTFFNTAGFNENFPYAGCEDQEFSRKALLKNIKLFYATDIYCLHNDFLTGDLNKWLKRQFTGIQGFIVLCEIFPDRKQSTLYSENHPIVAKDALPLKIKKMFKRLFYGRLGFALLKRITSLLEKLMFSERFLEKSYRLMGGMMIYQGFQAGFDNLKPFEYQDSKS